MKKGMSWPKIWLIAIVLVVAAYFLGQALHLDRHTTASALPTAAVVSMQP